MTREISDRLPDQVMRAFDGRDVEGKIGIAYLLMTVDPEGTPRPCMLSAGEILAPDDRHLRVALWPGTNTTRNLTNGSPVLLCYVAPGTTLYVRARPRALGRSEAVRLERFELDVVSVETDAHPGMPVTSPITFEVASGDVAKVADSWREQLRALAE